MNLLSYLFLLSSLPAQLSISCRHRLNHKCGGHVAGRERGVNKRYDFVCVSTADSWAKELLIYLDNITINSKNT